MRWFLLGLSGRMGWFMLEISTVATWFSSVRVKDVGEFTIVGDVGVDEGGFLNLFNEGDCSFSVTPCLPDGLWRKGLMHTGREIVLTDIFGYEILFL